MIWERNAMRWLIAVAAVIVTAPCALAQPPSTEVLPAPPPAAPPSNAPPRPPAEFHGLMGARPAHEEFHEDEYATYQAWPGEPLDWGDSWWVNWLGTRHSKTHGRAIGPGEPLRGTSWLNRPIGFAFEFGGLVMLGDPADGVASNNDLFAAIRGEWDWDHYWGGQIRVGFSTPELGTPGTVTDADGDSLVIADVSVQYYPWGDSRTRPYVRLGVGLTDIEFTNAAGIRQQEQLFTIPIALGVKRQIKRTVVWRAEVANNVAIGQNGADTIDNITFTFGVEGRFGGKPTGYWAWSPRSGAW